MHLVPELCRLTGLTEELLDDYKAMRDIKSVTHADAQVKVKECLRLFERFAQSKQCASILSEQGVEFGKSPHRVKAYKLDAGNLLMGKDAEGKAITHDIECCGRDIDRRVQCPMYE